MTGNQRWAVKAVVLWIVLVTAGMLAAMPFHWDVPPAKPEPWSPLVGMIVIGAAGALVMTLLAERAILRGWRLGLVLGVVLYMIETGLSLIEAVAFNRDLQVPMLLIVSSALSSLLRDAIAGAAIALLWRKVEAADTPHLRGLIWKPPVIAAVYVVCYVTAGLFAIAAPAAHAFYTHAPQISLVWLAELQLGRGLVWSALAFLIVRNLRGGPWATALVVGVTFAVLMDCQLLLPNPFMPWALRQVHMVEVGVSNLVFGALAASIWLSGAKGRSV